MSLDTARHVASTAPDEIPTTRGLATYVDDGAPEDRMRAIRKAIREYGVANYMAGRASAADKREGDWGRRTFEARRNLFRLLGIPQGEDHTNGV